MGGASAPSVNDHLTTMQGNSTTGSREQRIRAASRGEGSTCCSDLISNTFCSARLRRLRGPGHAYIYGVLASISKTRICDGVFCPFPTSSTPSVRRCLLVSRPSTPNASTNTRPNAPGSEGYRNSRPTRKRRTNAPTRRTLNHRAPIPAGIHCLGPPVDRPTRETRTRLWGARLGIRICLLPL